MSNWLNENLRDIDAFKAEGLIFSSISNESTKLFDSFLRQLVAWTDCPKMGGMEGTVEKMLSADPEAIIGRVVKCGLDVMSTGISFRINKELEKEILQLEKDAEKTGTEWEKSHVKAVKKWGHGFFREARAIWEEILKAHPTDLLSLKMAHDANFFLGDSMEIRDSIARVLPSWRQDMPGYSYLHGMYAFGLEECGQYREAEQEALKALELNRYDCWATHARAHVLEMTGRYEEGLAFMTKTVDDWLPGTYLATHNFWHKALYHVEKGEHETALSIFDGEVSPRTNRSCAMLDVVDSSSLLLRLKMENIDVGDRWKRLPDLSSHSNDHITVFNDIHFGVLFLGQGNIETERKMYDSLVNFTRNVTNDNSEINRIVGQQLYEGIVDYLDEKYGSVAEKLLPIRDKIQLIGGSHAQRDLFCQILIHSCINSEDKKHWEMTPLLLQERASIRRGKSPLAERLLLKFHEKHPL